VVISAPLDRRGRIVLTESRLAAAVDQALVARIDHVLLCPPIQHLFVFAT